MRRREDCGSCDSSGANAGQLPTTRKATNTVTDKGVSTTIDQICAEVDGHQLLVDVSVPNDAERPPLVVWIHGGGWRHGSQKSNRMPWLTDLGYAMASISYRLTDKAVFPAQIHDCKGAIRWLRRQADTFGYDATRVAAAGCSAGGHLAMLLGTSAGVEALEGDVGGNLDQSSAVSAVVQYCGPADFILRAETQPVSATTPQRGSFKLLNGHNLGHIDMELAVIASPTTYVGPDSPPMLTLHGQADETVLPDQAHRIAAVYQQHNAPHELHMVPAAGHGAQALFDGEYRAIAARFLQEHL